MSGGRLSTDLRITAGTLRGRRVPVPRGEVRPTSERARQAYFNIVAGRITGAHFLDLFAGSGIFSFEAMSRGAAAATAVDSSRQNIAAISDTAQRLEVAIETIVGDAVDVVRALASDAVGAPAGGRGKRLSRLAQGALPRPDAPFDLVYADPPYGFDRYDDLVEALDVAPLSEEAIVAVEHRRRTSPFTQQPRRLASWRRAEYGEVWITFFTNREAPGLQ